MIAAAAWLGLVLQYFDARAVRQNAWSALWGMLAYFTLLTNLLVALLFTLIALGHAVAPWLLGGAMLAIVLVGVIYAALLHDTPIGTQRASALANSMVHHVVPVVVPLYWIFFVPKGNLQWMDAVPWTAYPLLYLGYMLLRGRFTRHYPYPFLHVPDLGWAVTLRNAAAIAIAFIVASLALIGIDHMARPVA